MSLRQWVQHYQDEVVFSQVSYRGVTTLKNVLDLWVYQEIIWETRTEAVIEIGVHQGGSTLWLADTLRNLSGEGSLVVGIDLHRPEQQFPENVRFIEGDSLDPKTIATAAELCTGRRTMLIADGNHDASHVLQELRAYGPLVTDGCYFVVEDGIVDVMEWPFMPGPRVATEQFVAESSEFRIDPSREKFILTYCPGGFLRRVRESPVA